MWSFEGKFFKLKDCAIWPRPVQQPHPPIWIAARSAESIEWCVKRHLPCAQVYQTTGQIEDTFGYYRTKANEDGWDAGPDKFILCRHIYIDETEQKAREFGDPAMRYFFTVFNRGFNEAINKGAVDQKLTAALTSERSFSYFREGNRERHRFFQARLGRPDRQRLFDRRQSRQRRETDSKPDEANRRGSLHGHVPHRQLDARQSRQLAQSLQKRDHAETPIASPRGRAPQLSSSLKKNRSIATWPRLLSSTIHSFL